MTDSERIRDLENRLAQARTAIRACLDFLDTELHWEYFRIEMLYFDDAPKQTISDQNAQKLRNFLVEHRQIFEAI